MQAQTHILNMIAFFVTNAKQALSNAENSMFLFRRAHFVVIQSKIHARTLKAFTKIS